MVFAAVTVAWLLLSVGAGLVFAGSFVKLANRERFSLKKLLVVIAIGCVSLGGFRLFVSALPEIPAPNTVQGVFLLGPISILADSRSTSERAGSMVICLLLAAGVVGVIIRPRVLTAVLAMLAMLGWLFAGMLVIGAGC